MFPVHLGTDTQFTTLREALRACAYTEADAAHPLAKLFLECQHLPLDAPIPKDELSALGLIETVGDEIEATVMLYPIRGLYIVSDLNTRAEDETAPDIVYPANIATTALFLDHLPTTPCEAFLDLGSGTGIAALLAAQSHASHAWAFDITARSTHFAEFNRRLNDIPNVTPAESDLYAAACDLTFDRIVTHPPYVPVYRPRFVFDSGGQDGEQIIKRIVQGLSQYLRPGGRFYGLMMGSDREQPFEHRLREWLGESNADFDVVFIVRKTYSPRDYPADSVIKHKGSVEDIPKWRELFRQWGVRTLAYGTVIIQRRATERETFTIRRVAGEKTGPTECAWLVDWSTQSLDVDAKPRTRENVSLQVNHRFLEGEWQCHGYRLESNYPFEATLTAELWAANLLTLADGTQTIAELLDQLKTAESIPAHVTPPEFAKAVATLITAGFLEL